MPSEVYDMHVYDMFPCLATFLLFCGDFCCAQSLCWAFESVGRTHVHMAQCKTTTKLCGMINHVLLAGILIILVRCAQRARFAAAS